MDNPQLHARLEATESRAGWGRNHTLDFGGSKVFVKRLPLTDTEHAEFFSTRNLYNLPTFYNYGVGSAGFSAFRELVAHIKTTNWVLNGDIESFPLMYHYRVVPFLGQRAELNLEWHQRHVDYWGGDENIGRYARDRAGANHELLLFLEHIPHVLQHWLGANPGTVDTVLVDLRTTVNFLRKHGIIHFDAHFRNVLTDGHRHYLTDFGLVLDNSFDLSAGEQAFLKVHSHYDYGEVMACVGYLIQNAFHAIAENDQMRLKEKYGMQPDTPPDALRRILLNNLEAVHSDGTLKLPDSLVDCVLRYRGIIVLMDDFYLELRRNSKKDTKFPNAVLRRRLKESGFL